MLLLLNHHLRSLHLSHNHYYIYFLNHNQMNHKALPTVLYFFPKSLSKQTIQPKQKLSVKMINPNKYCQIQSSQSSMGILSMITYQVNNFQKMVCIDYMVGKSRLHRKNLSHPLSNQHSNDKLPKQLQQLLNIRNE